MSDNILLFAESSPYDSVEAAIEQDDQVAFFYLRGIHNNERFGMKSCWIRNLVDAPPLLDRERMTQGLPPTLPAEFCRVKEAQSQLRQQDLRVVWFEDGNGAALLENDEVLAVIPPRSGNDHVDGFARDCIVDSPLCFPLASGEHPLQQTVFKADQFWKSWQPESSPLHDYEPKIIAAYESAFGKMVEYLSIDDEKWPPRFLAKFHDEGKIILLTVGVSLCPQPGVELAFENPRPIRRFEWGACFDESVPQEWVNAFGRYLGGQLSIPWQYQTFFAHGHSVSCELFLNSETLPDFSAVLLCGDRQVGKLGWNGIPDVMGDPVNVLWSLPVFEKERKYIQDTNNYSLVATIIGEDLVPTIRARSTFV